MQQIRITSSNIPVVLLITAFQKVLRALDNTFSLLYWKYEDKAIIIDFYSTNMISYRELRNLIDRYIEDNQLNSVVDFSIVSV